MSDRVIRLPEVDYDGKFPLVKALSKRRSERDYSGEPLSEHELSMLLWSCQGITDPDLDLKTAPSAGAIFPFNLYVVLQEGIYMYDPKKHVLILHIEGDIRKALSAVSLGQKSIAEAAAVLALSYHPKYMQARYNERAFRYACMEAGHIAQNALLMAVALDLKAVAVGAYYDEFVKGLFELDNDILYMVAIGKD